MLRKIIAAICICSLPVAAHAGFMESVKSKISSTAHASDGSGTAKISVYFSPNGGCTDAVVSEIGKAKKEVLVQAYSFTSAPIAKALVEAHKRGVDVIAVLDKSQRTEKYTGATFLKNAAIPVFIDAKHAIMHNKVMIIDGKTIITGSFNFTSSAEKRNAENLLVINDDPALVKTYISNFKLHRGHSEAY